MEAKTLNHIENIAIEDVVGDAIGAVNGAVAGVIGKLLATRDGIKADLDEIKDKIAARLTDAGDLTKEKYDGIVRAIVSESEAAKKITTDQAKEIEAGLDDGYETVRETIHEHTRAREEPAKV
jgi:hypothetical protein